MLARLHFVVRVDRGAELPDLIDADLERIEARLAEATRSWDDDFAEALAAELGEERSAELSRRYAHAFPEGYKADFPPRTAVADLQQLEGSRRTSDFTAAASTSRSGAAPGERRFKIYRTDAPVLLTAVLPVLHRLGRRGRRRAARTSCKRADELAGLDLRLRPAAATTRSAIWATTPASGSRTRSPRAGPARPRTTASTPWCCGPA